MNIFMSLHFGNSLMFYINLKLLPRHNTEKRMGINGNSIPLYLPRKRKCFSRVTLLPCLGNICIHTFLFVNYTWFLTLRPRNDNIKLALWHEFSYISFSIKLRVVIWRPHAFYTFIFCHWIPLYFSPHIWFYMDLLFAHENKNKAC